MIFECAFGRQGRQELVVDSESVDDSLVSTVAQLVQADVKVQLLIKITIQDSGNPSWTRFWSDAAGDATRTPTSLQSGRPSDIWWAKLLYQIVTTVNQPLSILHVYNNINGSSVREFTSPLLALAAPDIHFYDDVVMSEDALNLFSTEYTKGQLRPEAIKIWTNSFKPSAPQLSLSLFSHRLAALVLSPEVRGFDDTEWQKRIVFQALRRALLRCKVTERRIGPYARNVACLAYAFQFQARKWEKLFNAACAKDELGLTPRCVCGVTEAERWLTVGEELFCLPCAAKCLKDVGHPLPALVEPSIGRDSVLAIVPWLLPMPRQALPLSLVDWGEAPFLLHLYCGTRLRVA